MVVEGAFVNAAVTATAAACFGYAGLRLWQRKRETNATVLFLAVVGLYLLLAALRQVAAGFENVEADRAIFLLLLVPAAASIVPLVYSVARIISPSRVLARVATTVEALAVVVGVGFAYYGGITGPITSPWGTDWTINHPVTRVVLLAFLMLPGIASAAYLILVGRRLEPPTSYRVTFLGWACGIYYVGFTADAIGLEGVALILARLATAIAAILAFVAYTRHEEGSTDADGGASVPP